ncbi:MAG TPA: allantoinase AllB [Candidatus Dormibacteraeota bacterium]|nr:allantoinase AllB [Candidatus Dormibacteraeota bacterium]
MIVRGGTVVTARGVERADIAIAGGRITAVGPNLAEDGEEIDASGLHVFPGGIDSHVHFDEPGRTEWEDIAHGSAALAAGGYTSFVDMPLNNLPVTTDVAAFDLKLEAMKRSSKVDFGLWAGLVPGNLDQLEPLVRGGVMGFKAFMCPSGIDEFPASDAVTLREGMKRIADLSSILLVHAEDPARLLEPAGSGALDFIRSRPPAAEWSAIAQAIDVAVATGCRLHVVHVSTARGMDLIRDAQQEGLDVSGETCPHYLLYREDDLDRLGGVAKCAPPFRTALDREALWAAEMIVSDHSPSTLDLKAGDDFTSIWGGISGCQSTRQLLLAQDRLDLAQVAAVTAKNIAVRFGLEGKGDIATAYDADLWIVDLSGDDVVRREDLLYRNAFSAHEGQRIRGRTVKTLIRGREPGWGKLIRPGAR